jgi:hypothetical protein|tara:strand:- start:1114 stop:1248 length:135 start_codon:yes stop_codon:yes gene_type:complete
LKISSELSIETMPIKWINPFEENIIFEMKKSFLSGGVKNLSRKS